MHSRQRHIKDLNNFTLYEHYSEIVSLFVETAFCRMKLCPYLLLGSSEVLYPVMLLTCCQLA